jgi:hypothetical protein
LPSLVALRAQLAADDLITKVGKCELQALLANRVEFLRSMVRRNSGLLNLLNIHLTFGYGMPMVAQMAI